MSLQKQDWELLNNIVAPEVLWPFPGSNLLSGQAKGANGLLLACRGLISYGMTFALKHLLYGTSGIVLLIEVRRARGEMEMNGQYCAVCSVGDNKLRAGELYVSGISMVDAFLQTGAAIPADSLLPRPSLN